MESTDLLMAALSSLVSTLPTAVVYVVVLVLAASKWKAHPRVSMFASMGAGLLLVLDLLARVFFTVMPMRLMRDGEATRAQTATLMGVMGVVSGVLHAVALGALVAAIFVDRGPPSREALR